MRWLVVILFLVATLVSFAQFSEEEQRKIDSINFVKSYNYGYDNKIFNQPYWDSLLSVLSDKKFNSKFTKEYLSSIYNCKGFIFSLNGEVDSSLQNYYKSLRIAELLGDSLQVAIRLNNIATIYSQQGSSDASIKQLKRALEIYENFTDTVTLAVILNSLAYEYRSQGLLDKSLECHSKSLALREKSKDSSGVANSLLNLGVIYENQGIKDKALEYYMESLNIRNKMKIKDYVGIISSLNNIGNFYCKNGENLTGLKYFIEANEIATTYNFIRDKAVSLHHIGATYCDIDSIEDGLDKLIESFKLFQKQDNSDWICYTAKLIIIHSLNNDVTINIKSYVDTSLYSATRTMSLEAKSSVYFSAFKYYKSEMNYKEALEMYELHIQMRDSIKNEETQKAAIRQQTKYEFEKAQLVKEQEEKEAARLLEEQTSRRNNLQYSMIFLGILLFFGLVLSLGFIKVSPAVAEGLIFFAFLILFEFLLVLADPYVEGWTRGEPMWKLLANAVLAGLIFPAHAFFERVLKRRLVKAD